MLSALSKRVGTCQFLNKNTRLIVPVIYDFAPSEWINPAWMHSYESADAFAGSQFGFGYGEPPQNSGLGNNGSYYYEMGEYSMGDLYGSNVGDGSAS